MAFSIGGHGYLCAVNSAPVNLANSLNYVFVPLAIAEAVVNFLFSILLVRYLGGGGVAFGTFLGTLLTVLWIAPLYVYRKTEKKIKFNYGPSVKHFVFVLLPLLICAVVVQKAGWAVGMRTGVNMIVVSLYMLFSYLLFKEDVKGVVSYIKNK